MKFLQLLQIIFSDRLLETALEVSGLVLIIVGIKNLSSVKKAVEVAKSEKRTELGLLDVYINLFIEVQKLLNKLDKDIEILEHFNIDNSQHLQRILLRVKDTGASGIKHKNVTNFEKINHLLQRIEKLGTEITDLETAFKAQTLKFTNSKIQADNRHVDFFRSKNLDQIELKVSRKHELEAAVATFKEESDQANAKREKLKELIGLIKSDLTSEIDSLRTIRDKKVKPVKFSLKYLSFV